MPSSENSSSLASVAMSINEATARFVVAANILCNASLLKTELPGQADGESLFDWMVRLGLAEDRYAAADALIVSNRLYDRLIYELWVQQRAKCGVIPDTKPETLTYKDGQPIHGIGALRPFLENIVSTVYLSRSLGHEFPEAKVVDMFLETINSRGFSLIQEDY
jgi:hypothetical protein